MTNPIINESCPYCGNTEFINALQTAQGSISGVENQWTGQNLYHVVCRRCGSIVRSYVREPEKLLKKKDRRN